jgi:cytochrome P450
VLGHDQLVQAALDYGTFSNVVPLFKTLRPPLECDPPEHTVYRRLLNPYFERERLDALEAPLRLYAAELLGPLLAAGGGDFAETFSHPFPTRALCLLLALPDGDWRLINDSSQRVDEVGGQGPSRSPERLAVGEELLVGIVMMVISAGPNTTTSAIGNTVLRRARDPQLQARIRAQRELIPALVEEVVGSADLDRGARRSRSRAEAEPARRLRARHPHVPRRAARPARGADRARGAARPHVLVRAGRRGRPAGVAAARRRPPAQRFT